MSLLKQKLNGLVTHIKGGIMDTERKKELLRYCKALIVEIKQYDSTSFIGFLANTSRYYANQNKHIEEYYQLIYQAMNSKSQVIGGDGAATRSYKKFLKEQLKLSISGRVIDIGDTEFKRLTLDEVAYVFGWLGRLVATDKENNKKRDYEKRSKDKNTGRSRNYMVGDETDWKDNPFAILIEGK